MTLIKKTFTVFEICQQTGLTEEVITRFIRHEWILPHENGLDHEDLARIELIIDLEQNLGVNEDAVPVILHLVDQIHFLRKEILNQENED